MAKTRTKAASATATHPMLFAISAVLYYCYQTIRAVLGMPLAILSFTRDLFSQTFSTQPQTTVVMPQPRRFPRPRREDPFRDFSAPSYWPRSTHWQKSEQERSLEEEKRLEKKQALKTEYQRIGNHYQIIETAQGIVEQLNSKFEDYASTLADDRCYHAYYFDKARGRIDKQYEHECKEFHAKLALAQQALAALTHDNPREFRSAFIRLHEMIDWLDIRLRPERANPEIRHKTAIASANKRSATKGIETPKLLGINEISFDKLRFVCNGADAMIHTAAKTRVMIDSEIKSLEPAAYR